MSGIVILSNSLSLATQEITSAGTIQSTATLITAHSVLIDAGTVNQGVRLPPVLTGDMFFIYNSLGVTIVLYPASGETIDGVGATGVTLLTHKGVMVWAPVAGVSFGVNLTGLS